MSLGKPIYNLFDNKKGLIYSGDSASEYQKSFAGLQNSNAQSGVGTPSASIPGINQVELPSWLSTNPDKNLSELTSTYAGIGAAFDPTEQVKARNDAIGYNTSAGNQAANNAATEYANRASQQGTSALGAGVVKAQAMMPVLQQNAALKTDAADIAAKSHQQAAGLAAQIASTIGQLRTSYLNTLTGYATGQQDLALKKYGLEQDAANQARLAALQSAQLSASRYQTEQQAKQSDDASRRAAILATLGIQAPSAQYNVGPQGNILSGQDDYNRLKNWQSNRDRASAALAGMF